MPDDVRTIDVAVPVAADRAAALQDDATRLLAGHLVTRMLQPASMDRLIAVMDQVAAEAERRGLTHAMLEAELAAYNAEGRQTDTPPPA